MPDQPELLPAERPPLRRDSRVVALEYLDFDHEAGEPSAHLVASVRRLGVMLPVLVRAAPSGRFVVVDGVRRCKAAARVGIPKLQVVVKSDAIHDDVATLVANNQRSPNPQTELAAIDRLIARTGAPPKEISRQLGIPYATVKRRLKLRKLTKSARALFQAGEISVGVAEKLSRLPNAEQRAVLARAKSEDVRVTATLVNDARQVQTRQAIAQLAPAIFQGPTVADVTGAKAVPISIVQRHKLDNLITLCRSDVKADDALRTLGFIAQELEEILHYG